MVNAPEMKVEFGGLCGLDTGRGLAGEMAEWPKAAVC